MSQNITPSGSSIPSCTFRRPPKYATHPPHLDDAATVLQARDLALARIQSRWRTRTREAPPRGRPRSPRRLQMDDSGFLDMMNVGSGEVNWSETQYSNPIPEQETMSTPDVSAPAKSKSKPAKAPSTKGKIGLVLRTKC